MSVITSDRSTYEQSMGLGQDPTVDSALNDPNFWLNLQSGLQTDVSSGYTSLQNWIQNYAPVPTAAPTSGASAVANGSGFNWASLIAPIESTGLTIAKQLTNPAYTTPGAYTRLPDGTIIATAGTSQTGYTSVAPSSGANLLNPASGGMGSLLLIGVAVLAVVMIAGKR